MNRRNRKKPPRPGMKWSRKHGMWVDPDTRDAARKAADEQVFARAEADQARFQEALKRLAGARKEHASAIESAAAAVAGKLLGSLIEARKKSGLSQAAVARRMGVTQPAVVRLEAGTHSPTLSTLSRYAAAVGVNLEARRLSG